MLGLLEGEDLIAAEAQYHGSCLASYTWKQTVLTKETDSTTTDAHCHAFEKRVKAIDEDLDKGKAFKHKNLYTHKNLDTA